MEPVPAIEILHNSPPRVIYEGKVFSSANYNPTDTAPLPEDNRVISGFNAIDEHVEALFEQWEEGEPLAGIDALTIIEAFSDHYNEIPQVLKDRLFAQVLDEIKTSSHPADIITQCMQLPYVYEQLTNTVMEMLYSGSSLRTLNDPLVSGYLEAYAEHELGRGGTLDALRALLTLQDKQ